VRKGQCADGKPALNRGGAAVGEWSREVGLRQASFECSESDYDEHGRLWLLLEVRPSDASGDATWQIKDLALSFDSADVVAPPNAIALDPTPGPTERE